MQRYNANTNQTAAAALGTSRTTHNTVLQCTVHLVDLYRRVNPEFSYDKKTRNPKRVLTVPSEGVYNDSLDNKDNELILSVGDDLDGNRYSVIDRLGSGAFGQVVKCLDSKTNTEVAVKVIKNQTTYLRQAEFEVRILHKVGYRPTAVAGGVGLGLLEVGGVSGNSDGQQDNNTKGCQKDLLQVTVPDHDNNNTVADAHHQTDKSEPPATTSTIRTSTATRYPVVQLLNHFKHKNHLCLVFELLEANLLELLQRNNYKGLSMGVLLCFTQQLLLGLQLLKEKGIIHCDLKPENVLLADSGTINIKIIDLGSACYEGHTMYTYIQSRYYRSPEVLLGHEYDCKIDIWSIGCLLAELFLGLPLFPGSTEYNQLARIVEMLGYPSIKVLENSKQVGKFFTRVPSTEPDSEECPAFPWLEAQRRQLEQSMWSGFPSSYYTADVVDDPPVVPINTHKLNTSEKLPEGTSATAKREYTLPPKLPSIRTAAQTNAPLPPPAQFPNIGGFRFRNSKEYEEQAGKQPGAGEWKRYLNYTTLEDLVANAPYQEETEAGKVKECEDRKKFHDFLLGLLNPDPYERWTPEYALRHPFVTSGPFQGIGHFHKHFVLPALQQEARLKQEQQEQERLQAAAMHDWITCPQSGTFNMLGTTPPTPPPKGAMLMMGAAAGGSSTSWVGGGSTPTTLNGIFGTTPPHNSQQGYQPQLQGAPHTPHTPHTPHNSNNNAPGGGSSAPQHLSLNGTPAQQLFSSTPPHCWQNSPSTNSNLMEPCTPPIPFPIGSNNNNNSPWGYSSTALGVSPSQYDCGASGGLGLHTPMGTPIVNSFSIGSVGSGASHGSTGSMGGYVQQQSGVPQQACGSSSSSGSGSATTPQQATSAPTEGGGSMLSMMMLASQASQGIPGSQSDWSTAEATVPHNIPPLYEPPYHVASSHPQQHAHHLQNSAHQPNNRQHYHNTRNSSTTGGGVGGYTPSPPGNTTKGRGKGNKGKRNRARSWANNEYQPHQQQHPGNGARGAGRGRVKGKHGRDNNNTLYVPNNNPCMGNTISIGSPNSNTSSSASKGSVGYGALSSPPFLPHSGHLPTSPAGSDIFGFED